LDQSRIVVTVRALFDGEAVPHVPMKGAAAMSPAKTATQRKAKALHKAKIARDAKTGWLIMLYMAGDNNLSEAMVLSLQTLKTLRVGGSAGDAAIVAQLDPSGVGLPTQTYDFTHAGASSRFHLDECRTIGAAPTEANTGNPNALSGFIKWAHNLYPNATRHLLVLSGHGSGTTEDFLLRDDNAADALSIDELGIALSDAYQVLKKKIDILGMDACFMSMGEVCYQIREHVDILIGAEGMEPQFGWPYSRILDEAKRLARGKILEPEQLAKTIVEQYVEFYSDYDRSAGRSVDLAAINLRKLHLLHGPFTRLIRALNSAKVAEKEDKRSRLVYAHWRAQTYKADQFVDLYDLCEQTRIQFDGVKGATNIVKACVEVKEGLTKCVLKSGCSGFAYQHSHGLSVYFPWSAVRADYRKLKFATSSGWGKFLERFVSNTRRDKRFDEGQKRHDDRAVRALTTVLTQAHIQPLQNAMARRKGIGTLRASVKLAFEQRLFRQLKRAPRCDLPFEDLSTNVGNSLGRTSFGPHNSRYTGEGSRYTGEGSRYTGEGSRYTGEGSRAPADREKSMKNLPVVIGKTFWPTDPEP
jgi:hypothetical protein